MQCPDLDELERLACDALDGARATQLRSHLEACAACRALGEEMRANQAFQDEWSGALRGAPGAGTASARIPGYEISGEIHRGGQGVVFAARQCSTNRRVALKLLHQGAFAGARQRRRFEREVDLAASLHHPNVVTVFDSGRSESGELFFAMELVDGRPLDEELAARDLDVAARLRLFVQICDGVYHAHQRGILHRDLKPGNILVDREGQPRVVDFGLARPLDMVAAEGTEATIPGEFVGTLAYASPEQLERDAAAVDVRCDVHGLGVILFQMLTGELPYDTSGPLAGVVLRILNSAPERPSTHAPGLDPDLDAVVARALAKRPEERYGSVAELAADVRHHLAGEPILARADSRAYVLRKQMKRHRVALSTASLVLASLIAATIISFLFWRRAVRERDHLREVRDFQGRMIAMANPYADGYTVTVAELLDSAGRRLAGEYLDQPELRAELESIVAESYAGLGLDAQAEQHYVVALELWSELYGEHAPAALEARLGQVSCAAASLPAAAAEAAFIEIAELCRVHLGADHETSLTAMTSLARLREDRGEHEAAEELFRDVLERSARSEARELGHAASLQNLAACLLTQGRADEAEPILREVHDWRRRVQGEEHPSTLTAANVLGQTWARLGRWAEAEELLRRALDARRRVFGEVSGQALGSLNALGLCLLAKGETAQAREVLGEAVEVARAVLPAHHVELMRVQRSLGGALWELGEIEAARALLEETCAGLVLHQGATHPETLETRVGLACTLQASREFEGAIAIFEDVIERCPDDHPGREVFLGQARLYLGACFSMLDLPEVAEPHLLEGFERLRDDLGLGHPKTQVAVRTLVDLYREVDRPDEVQRYLALIATEEPTGASDPP